MLTPTPPPDRPPLGPGIPGCPRPGHPLPCPVFPHPSPVRSLLSIPLLVPHPLWYLRLSPAPPLLPHTSMYGQHPPGGPVPLWGPWAGSGVPQVPLDAALGGSGGATSGSWGTPQPCPTPLGVWALQRPGPFPRYLLGEGNPSLSANPDSCWVGLCLRLESLMAFIWLAFLKKQPQYEAGCGEAPCSLGCFLEGPKIPLQIPQPLCFLPSPAGSSPPILPVSAHRN